MARPPTSRLWVWRLTRRTLQALLTRSRDALRAPTARTATWTAAIAAGGHVAAAAAGRWVPGVEASYVAAWLTAPAVSAATLSASILALVLARLTAAATFATWLGAAALLVGLAGPAVALAVPVVAASLIVIGGLELLLRTSFRAGEPAR